MKKYFEEILLATIVLATFAGCAMTAKELPSKMETLAKGTQSGITEPRQVLIRDEDTWNQFWAKHVSQTIPMPPAPMVDFSKHSVLAVTLGRRRTGGYGIEITQVARHEGVVRVRVRTSVPSKDGFTLQALTTPFHFVTVPRIDPETPIEFIPTS